MSCCRGMLDKVMSMISEAKQGYMYVVRSGSKRLHICSQIRLDKVTSVLSG
jgi:hypothetical protein